MDKAASKSKPPMLESSFFFGFSLSWLGAARQVPALSLRRLARRLCLGHVLLAKQDLCLRGSDALTRFEETTYSPPHRQRPPSK